MDHMFPIHIHEKGQKYEDDDIAYIVGRDGIYLKKEVGLISSVTKVNRISTLDDVEESASFDIPKIPQAIILQVVSFFRKVYDEYSGEATVILKLNQVTEEFSIDVPKQEVSGAHLKYTQNITSEQDVLRIGTIHSHCNFNAFHSTTDTTDEADWDGIHLTIGNLKSATPSLSGELEVNKQRFILDLTDYLDIPLEKDNASTLNVHKSVDYNLCIPEELNTTFPDEWMDQVTKYVSKVVHTAYNHSHYNPYSQYNPYDYHNSDNCNKPYKGFHHLQKHIFGNLMNPGFCSDELKDDDQPHPCLKCPNINLRAEQLADQLQLQEDDADEMLFDDADEFDGIIYDENILDNDLTEPLEDDTDGDISEKLFKGGME